MNRCKDWIGVHFYRCVDWALSESDPKDVTQVVTGLIKSKHPVKSTFPGDSVLFSRICKGKFKCRDIRPSRIAGEIPKGGIVGIVVGHREIISCSWECPAVSLLCRY